MQARNASRDEISELKMYIIRQQELAAELERAGEKAASASRAQQALPAAASSRRAPGGFARSLTFASRSAHDSHG
jgi:hypothetical protein